MARCPFHDDRRPSLYVDGGHFHCFACGAHGDCIDFAARLFRLTPLEAARKLAADFGVAQEKPKKHDEAQRLGKDERLCFLRLSEHCRALRRRKAEFAPRRPGDGFDARFAAACRELEYAEYLLDELKLDALLSDVKLGNYKERVRQISALLDRYIPDVERMGTELKKYKAAFDSTGAELKALRSESTLKKLRDNQLRRDYEEALAVIGRLPPEVLKQYQGRSTARERKTVSK